MTKISIIIPVFQVEDYIAQRIDSILKQTFQDFELLLIDDGSKDDSGKICDEYAVMNEKVRVIHQINAGVTAARRKGVEMSGGEWLCFVDSDDTLPEDSLEVLVHASQGVDIVIGNFQIVNEDGCIEVCRKTVFQGDSMKWDHIAYLRAMLESRTPASVWGRLVKRELFDEQIFNIPREIVLGEDYILCIRLAVKNIKVKNINDIVIIGFLCKIPLFRSITFVL